MARLHITGLKCIRQQDVVGVDEPVIWIAGQFVWGGKMDKHDFVPLNLNHDFSQSVLLQLKEANGAAEHDGKLLGYWTLQATPAQDKLTATSSGYHYEVWYHVH
jgi:hypothetical protein